MPADDDTRPITHRPYPSYPTEPASTYTPPERPAHVSPLLLTSNTRRPFVVSMKDWLSCVALFLVSVLMLAMLFLGNRAYQAGHDLFDQWSRPSTQPTINWEPDPLPTTDCVGEVPCD